METGEIRGGDLKACESAGEARASIGRYLDFYNRRRPHSSLDRRTPDDGLLRSGALTGGGVTFPPRAGRDFGRATPSLRHAQRAKPRNKRNPAGLPLSLAGICSDNQSQLYEPARRGRQGCRFRPLRLKAERLRCGGERRNARCREDRRCCVEFQWRNWRRKEPRGSGRAEKACATGDQDTSLSQ